MIFLAAMLASGDVLPWVDRRWLNERARLEAAASASPKRELKVKTTAPAKTDRKLISFVNTTGM